jgi:hypothetical protein
MEKNYHRLRRWSMQAGGCVIRAAFFGVSLFRQAFDQFAYEVVELEKSTRCFSFY